LGYVARLTCRGGGEGIYPVQFHADEE